VRLLPNEFERGELFEVEVPFVAFGRMALAAVLREQRPHRRGERIVRSGGALLRTNDAGARDREEQQQGARLGTWHVSQRPRGPWPGPC
jgi:hypothetical protein